MTDVHLMAVEFRARFRKSPGLACRAPGRVNLIGEHIDYNGGPVMPFAIDRGITVFAAPNGTNSLRLASVGRHNVVERCLRDIRPIAQWTDHAMGVADHLLSQGVPLRGCDILYASDLPEGAGLSSSAAFEVATYRILFEMFASGEFDPVATALDCQLVENEFIGVKCGIMDQYAVANGKAGQAMLLDCTTLTCRHIPIDVKDHIWMVMDSRTPRTLATSAYNVRRMQCAEALADLRVIRSELHDLASADIRDLHLISLPEMRKRARHVMTETARVKVMAEALQKEDVAVIGQLLKESHTSLRYDYEVSCAELDALVDRACAQPSCPGARMTGAGFGGCCLALVRADGALTFKKSVTSAFLARFGRIPDVFVAQATDGVHSITLL